MDQDDMLQESIKVRPINIYAALGVGLESGLLAAIMPIVIGFLASTFFSGSSSMLSMLFFMLILFGVVLFLALPPLFASKHGWRTVVTSYIVQAFVVVLVMLIYGLVTSSDSQPVDQYYYNN